MNPTQTDLQIDATSQMSDFLPFNEWESPQLEKCAKSIFICRERKKDLKNLQRLSGCLRYAVHRLSHRGKLELRTLN